MNEPKHWEQTMTPDEVKFIWREFNRITNKVGSDWYPAYSCCGNFRAARIWKSSQRRRYRKQQDKGCCGFYDVLVHRWNWEERLDYDIYMIGFNYGH